MDSDDSVHDPLIQPCALDVEKRTKRSCSCWSRRSRPCKVAIGFVVLVTLVGVGMITYIMVPKDTPIEPEPPIFTVPDAPVLIESDFSSTTLSLEWEEPDAHGNPVTSYELQMLQETNSGDAEFKDVYLGGSKQSIIDHLWGRHNYTFRVRATNSIGPSDYSPPVTFETAPPTAPMAPAPLLLINTGRDFLEVAWTEPFNDGAPVTNFRLDIGQGQGASVDYSPVCCDTYTKTFKVSALHMAKYYSLRVAALNSVGLGPFSDVFVAKTNSLIPLAPSQPSPPVAVDVEIKTAELSWKFPEGHGAMILSCELQLKQGANPFETAYTGPDTAVVVPDLLPDTSYSAHVRCRNSVGDSPYSTAISFQTLSATAPDIPTPPTLTAAQAGLLSLSWVAPEDFGSPITSYQLQRADEYLGKPFSTVFDGLALTATVNGLAPATNSVFRLKAVNVLGASGWSVNVTFTTSNNGSCGNPHDMAIFKAMWTTVQDTIQGCAFSCVLSGTDCMKTCVDKKVGFTEPCTMCWIVLATCTKDKCIFPCIVPSSEACLTCSAEKCFPALLECSGVPRWALPG